MYELPLSPTRPRWKSDLDLNIDELTERFVLPYRSGLPITINGRSFAAEDVERIQIKQD